MKVNINDLKENLITEHNKLRTDPKSYIPLLEKHLEYINKDNVLVIPNEIKLKLIEGASTYNNAIEFLKNQANMATMEHNEQISQASLDHAVDIGSNGLFTHEGSDGRNTADRIEKYIEWDGACCESIEFGNRTAENVLISLLIDDGIEHRPHRKNIFSEELKFFGVGVSEHKTYGVVTVINYLAGIRVDGKVDFDYENFKYEVRDNVPKIEKKVDDDEAKNPYQVDDPDAPNGTTSVQIFKKTKKDGEKVVNITKKMYKLENGTYHIVEVEEQT